jgi:IMP dehydrogenase
VPHRGEAGLVVHRLVGGLRSAMSYADAHTIAEFHANARFVRITTAGLIESRPHDLH